MVSTQLQSNQVNQSNEMALVFARKLISLAAIGDTEKFEKTARLGWKFFNDRNITSITVGEFETIKHDPTIYGGDYTYSETYSIGIVQGSEMYKNHFYLTTSPYRNSIALGATQRSLSNKNEQAYFQKLAQYLGI